MQSYLLNKISLMMLTSINNLFHIQKVEFLPPSNRLHPRHIYRNVRKRSHHILNEKKRALKKERKIMLCKFGSI